MGDRTIFLEAIGISTYLFIAMDRNVERNCKIILGPSKVLLFSFKQIQSDVNSLKPVFSRKCFHEHNFKNPLVTNDRGLANLHGTHQSLRCPCSTGSGCALPCLEAGSRSAWGRRLIVYRSQTQTLDFSSPPAGTFDLPSPLTARVNTNDVFTTGR